MIFILPSLDNLFRSLIIYSKFYVQFGSPSPSYHQPDNDRTLYPTLSIPPKEPQPLALVLKKLPQERLHPHDIVPGRKRIQISLRIVRRNTIVNRKEERSLFGYDIQPHPGALVLAEYQQESTPHKHLEQNPNELQN
jgi:hypothetical protein